MHLIRVILIRAQTKNKILIFIQKYLLIVLLFMEHICFGQNLILSSKVVDFDTRESLPYVNIIVKDKLIGTFSDENGTFHIEYVKGDSLIVSHVGYEKLIVLAEEIEELIQLKEQPNILTEVAISSSRKTKTKLLGVLKKKADTYMGGVLQYAMFFENNEGEIGFIKKLHFEIGHSVNRGKENKKQAKIRIRIYEKDSTTGKPGMDILKKEKIVTIKPNQRNVNVDISEENIYFPLNGLFVGIDILGFVDESGRLINYHISDAKKHLRIPLTNVIIEPLTYINPIGQRWVLCQTLSSKAGKLTSSNACFEIIVEF